MCGIVGILGREPVAGRIVDALKRLEYRGYDSAGVATLDDGRLSRRRAEGKLRNLETRLSKEPLSGVVGIGHTRWATHGKPTETNAHPHSTRRLALVHNGIFENFRELRDELAAAGHAFETETDTEVAAHLVTGHLDAGMAPRAAVAAAAKRLRGAYALVFLFAGAQETLIGVCHGAPLAVGYGADELYLGSDALALAPFTDDIAYLRDGDVAELTRSGVAMTDFDGRPLSRRRERSAASALLVDRGNHRHFMAKEIHEQPEVVGRTIAHYVDMSAGLTKMPFAWPVAPANLKRVLIVACGTAHYAGLAGKIWIERFARLPVEIDVASEFRYRDAPMGEGDLVIVVSQSGETADTLASLRHARSKGAKALGIVNVPTSTIARECDALAPTLAGPEIGVASTKAFTCQLAALASIAIALGRA
ncbi:MAG: glutamine--fructose-6-phosphate transaminase (isomerizing), partial [Hyphomicrobiales bacterium]|nr:glutamine--fructose-6-phosphate transaminase (isomerizing) [Hyphomicrobiales bacterium]